jgi:hypothetical protein
LRIRNNNKLEKLVRGEYIVKCIRAQRIKWRRHLDRVEKTKSVMKITKWKPIGMKYKDVRKICGEMRR